MPRHQPPRDPLPGPGDIMDYGEVPGSPDVFANLDDTMGGDGKVRMVQRGTRRGFPGWLKAVLVGGSLLAAGALSNRFLCGEKEESAKKEDKPKVEVPEEPGIKEPKKEKPVFIPPQKPLKQRYGGTPDEPSPE